MNKTLIVYICIFAAIAMGNMYLSFFRKKQKNTKIGGIENVVLKLNNRKTKIILNKTDSVSDLIKLLPVEGTMKNAGGKLSLKLPTKIKSDPVKVTTVYKGDVMLENDDLLIIYFESQNVNKNYTKIGKVLLINQLDEISDFGQVDIVINKE